MSLFLLISYFDTEQNSAEEVRHIITQEYMTFGLQLCKLDMALWDAVGLLHAQGYSE